MKILHILAQKPTRTGSGVYYSNIIEEFKKFGHEQAAIFAVQDDFVFDVLPKTSQYPVEFKTAALPFAVAGMSDVMPYDNTIYSQMNEGMISAWQGAFRAVLLQAKAGFSPDVVVLHHLWMLTSMAIEIFDNCRKVCMCHNTDLRQAEQHPHMKERFVKNLDALDLVMTLSDSAKPRIADIYGIDPKKIATIGGGFSQNIFYPSANKPKNGKVQIVYAAKIEQSKGIFELVHAFKKVTALADCVHLNIVGTPDTDNRRKLDEIISECDNISLVHITNQKVLADFLREADIFVMPSFYEGLGLIAIESLASGLRVVATEIDALMAQLGEKVNNSGVLRRLSRTFSPSEQKNKAGRVFALPLSTYLTRISIIFISVLIDCTHCICKIFIRYSIENEFKYP